MTEEAADPRFTEDRIRNEACTNECENGRVNAHARLRPVHGPCKRPGLLAIDVGTTHCKAGLFAENGVPVRLAKRPTVSCRKEGVEFYDPEQMWETITELIREVLCGETAYAVAGVGITSMAESGLLVDRRNGEPRSPFIPWFSPCSRQQAERIAAEGDPLERFIATGLRSSYKFGLAKLLWIRERDPHACKGAVWLSASDFAAYRLTGRFATDYTLAARTFAFRIDRKAWDTDWIRHFGLDPSVFPETCRSGTPVGAVTAEAAQALGLPAGIPVVIAGHDHVSAAYAVGAITPGRVLDSMGTAETLIGMLPERPLTERDYEAGLAYGCHIEPHALFWMGGVSASGGSVEWLRSILAEPALGYDEVLRLLDNAAPGPTGLLYFPYLSGSGAPRPDAKAKAAFVGLQAGHGRAELLKAVLEGTAYEMESIRRAAEQVAGTRIDQVTAVGGGMHNRAWLQIKANVSGSTLVCPELAEAALVGAAMLAGIAGGVYANGQEARAAAVEGNRHRTVLPDLEQVAVYRDLYERGYVKLQEPLRAFSSIFHS